tara:strand:- start:3 stop:266 length:264 start_codon:yes stop_codon:yes gene_type:complete
MPTKAEQERMEEEWNNLSEEEQQKRLEAQEISRMIEEINMRGEPPVDSDGWSWEEYETTFNGKEVVVRVQVEIVRYWETVEIVKEDA